jgi:hypothetical protein
MIGTSSADTLTPRNPVRWRIARSRGSKPDSRSKTNVHPGANSSFPLIPMFEFCSVLGSEATDEAVIVDIIEEPVPGVV